jgi:hypothetical protein
MNLLVVMASKLLDAPPEHRDRGDYRPTKARRFGSTDGDPGLPADPIIGDGNRESCDSSNTHECAFGIPEMTDDKTIR